MTFELEPYPYDRLDGLRETASKHPGGAVDLSIGTPVDPPPRVALSALSSSGAERSYPPSAGTVAFREACAAWMERRFGVVVEPDWIGACVGTKEYVASLPGYLKLREEDKGTVLFPALSYPTYSMGARLAGLTPVAVPELPGGGLDLDAISPHDRNDALLLWVNSPSNPTGALTDLAGCAEWGRKYGVPVASDECYADYTWDALSAHSVLESGTGGVLAVHSLSKRSNLAGLRAGFYTGDPSLVSFLVEVRKHAGLMVPGPVQAAASSALGDEGHVRRQRAIYHSRLVRLANILTAVGVEAGLPRGGFYLWVPVPSSMGDCWDLAGWLATRLGMVVSPGIFYGEGGKYHVRVAAVASEDRLDLLASRV
ncbi:MAG: aminotransferase class I/II-fold pyridoxal phosphate-dependent enzyme [Actinobacteria bacterium]|nr:aminotransferase class I/II-fold pyridoxal phosphate-dependent enzyme [Actinomycetota bacterium]